MRTVRFLGWTALAASAFLVAPAMSAAGLNPASATAAPTVTNSTAAPPVHILTSGTGVAPGLLFANPRPARDTDPTWTAGPMIYDNAGNVIWYLPNKKVHTTLPVTYKGKPAVAYHLDASSAGPWSSGSWIVLNQSYQKIGVIGHGVDHHELLTTSKGTMAYVDSYHPVSYDLSQFGGPVDGTVEEAVISEINLITGKVVWQWHSLAHVPVTDTYRDLTASPVDYMHINSIAVDTDGNLIVSGRTLSAVLKINRKSGKVMWRLGGKRSSFLITNDSGPSFQHDARVMGRNTYSVFDNGDSRDPQYSRGVTFQVDPITHTARVVGQWHHDPDIYSSIEGSFRKLPNGDRLIGWATAGIATEYAGHTVVWESEIDGAYSYRTLRSPWHATPAAPPALAVRRNGGTLTASASWNGATDVVRWEVLGGPNAAHLRPLRTVPYTGFQMTQTMAAPAADRVFAVRAIRSNSPAVQSAVATAR